MHRCGVQIQHSLGLTFNSSTTLRNRMPQYFCRMSPFVSFLMVGYPANAFGVKFGLPCMYQEFQVWNCQNQSEMKRRLMGTSFSFQTVGEAVCTLDGSLPASLQGQNHGRQFIQLGSSEHLVFSENAASEPRPTDNC